ncbi:MAG: tRNA lysidine(34) synthetase TilS [Raoultibacter sp.]|jgi:tRNA(Ile)-lysidine synthase
MRDGKQLLERMKQTIEERHLTETDSPVLLMVSGGSDSTALAYLAAELVEEGAIGALSMLHVNHNLRGEDSDEDQRFVETLAESLDIPLFTCEVDVAGEVGRTGENEEAVSRRERYLAANEALESFCRHKASPLADGRIFTAHTQDDRVENFYMRSIVGTGPGGFRSMLYRNGPVVRPLLDVSREELRAYISAREVEGKKTICDAQGNLWREDATNAHTDRFRAYVRHEIIPLMRQRNPQLLETLCRSMNLIADEDDMLDDMCEQIEERVASWLESAEDESSVRFEGCVLEPSFAEIEKPMQRRVGAQVLQKILGPEVRIESRSIEAILEGFSAEGPIGGYTNNIQGDLALSANKYGLRIEPMSEYRSRRKKD